MSIIRIAFAVILALFATSAQAGSLIYVFIAGSNQPDAGEVVADLIFSSPPALSNGYWQTLELSTWPRRPRGSPSWQRSWPASRTLCSRARWMTISPRREYC
jgi:hypothetical protein